MNGYKMIIARHKEDVSWSEKYNSIVYNKGDDEIEGSINLENLGREAHTYLRHIITNYHNLDDTMIFIQGNPFEHQIDIEILFDIQEKGYSHKLNLSNDRWGEDMSNKKDFTITEWKGQISNPKGYKLGEWWEETTGDPYERSSMVFWNSILSVNKEFVLKRSLESYMSIYNTLLHSSIPVEAHYCERTWSNIFNL